MSAANQFPAANDAGELAIAGETVDETNSFDISRGVWDFAAVSVQQCVTLEEMADIVRRAEQRWPPCSFADYQSADKVKRAELKRSEWFTLATFKDQRRAKDNITAATGVVLDVDKGTSHVALIAALDLLGCDYLAFNSTSHGVSGDAWRVVIPLAEPITGSPDAIARRYAEVWSWFAARVPGVDPGAKDCTRLNYLPFKLLGAPTRSVIGKERGSRFDAATVEIATPVAPAAPGVNSTLSDVPTHDATLTEAREMLRHVDADCDYERWASILWSLRRMALGAQDGSNVAQWFALANEWSARSAKYPGSEAVEEKWLQADTRETGFGLKHLVELAKAGGFNPPPRVANAEAFPPVTSDAGTPRTQITHVLITDFMNQPEPSWLVDSVLMMDSILAVVYGEPGSGKSTIVLEMLLAVARGIKWHGREVEQGAVAYLAAESVVGLRKRLRAYELVNGIQRDTLKELFFPIARGLNLSNNDDVENLIKYLKTLPTKHTLRVLAIDTLSQVTPGVNENTSEMNVPLKACKRIYAETGAIILLIAHCGKDQARGIRGWSGILGALDSEIEVSWDRESDVRSVAVRKQRDGECNFGLFGCTLERIAYGHDSKDRELSSVVIKEAPRQDLPTSAVRRAIRDVFDVVGRPMSLQDLVKAAKEKLDPPEAGKKDRRAECVKAAYKRMLDDNTLTVRAGLISLVIPFGLVADQPANADLIGDVA